MLGVAPHGPLIDIEALGQRFRRVGAPALQDLEQGEHARCRPGHTADNTGPILSGIAPTVLTMNLTSIRLITADVTRLTDFYSLVTGLPARRWTPDFAELTTPGGATLAIGSTATVPWAASATNRSAIVEFRVDDVDADYARIREAVDDVVQEPTTMPWGNRSLLLRDPDGTLVNLFTPVVR
jgi:predicted enzyme related to lactoylglutathione lyase